jgi:sec-independent protein translocase protein TatA
MFDGISIWQLLIILAIVIVVFGTKRLSSVGGDVGKAIKSFKKAMNDDDDETADKQDAQFTSADRQTDAKAESDSKD